MKLILRFLRSLFDIIAISKLGPSEYTDIIVLRVSYDSSQYLYWIHTAFFNANAWYTKHYFLTPFCPIIKYVFVNFLGRDCYNIFIRQNNKELYVKMKRGEDGTSYIQSYPMLSIQLLRYMIPPFFKYS